MLAALALSIALLPTTAPVDDTRTRASLRIAKDFWGASPCATYHVYKAPIQPYEGYTDNRCRIWVNDWTYQWNTTYERASYCSMLVHEVGHNLGYQHTADPASIMAADAPRLVKACDKRFRARVGAPYARPPSYPPEAPGARSPASG